MLCSCCTIRVTNYSGSLARNSGSRLNLPGISHFHSHPVGKRLVQELDATERAFYGHPDARYRVPHPTYRGTLSRPRVASVRRAVVATVNNFGGRLWFLKSHFRTRNRMILDRRVELFGLPEAWAQFRHFPKLWIRRPPDNYMGRASPARRR